MDLTEKQKAELRRRVRQRREQERQQAYNLAGTVLLIVCATILVIFG